MKKTLRYTSLSALALLAAVTLAACGGNAEKTTASSSKEASSKVTKESSSKTEASQKEEQKSETSSSSATATQTETKTENQKDYSKFLGTWENYAGTTATVTADGIVTIQSSKGTFKYEMDKSRGEGRLLFDRNSSCWWWRRSTPYLYPSRRSK